MTTTPTPPSHADAPDATTRQGFCICYTETASDGGPVDEFLGAFTGDPEFATLEEVRAYIDEHRDDLPEGARPGQFTRDGGLTDSGVWSAVPEGKD